MQKNRKILAYKWYSYNDLDIEYTFLQLGYEVVYVEREKLTYDKDDEFESKIRAELQKGIYTCFFSMNYFPAISNLCASLHVKYLAWTCDNPLISMYDSSIFHSCNYIFTFDKSNYLEFLERGVKHIYHLPLAVNTKRIQMLLKEKDKTKSNRSSILEKEYWYDVSFVGSLYQKRSTYDRLKHTFPEYLNGYLDGMVQARLVLGTNEILDEMMTADILKLLEENYHLEKSESAFSDLGLIFQTTVLGFKIAQKQRMEALRELAKQVSLFVFHKEDEKEILFANEPGPVNYHLEMPFVFHRSKINLNFTIPNIKTGIPLRVFDILGAKGFLLTNPQAEILELFEDGVDLVCFYNTKDLIEKTNYYLAHPKERQAIAESGYQKVKKYHTYNKRLSKMLELANIKDI